MLENIMSQVGQNEVLKAQLSCFTSGVDKKGLSVSL